MLPGTPREYLLKAIQNPTRALSVLADITGRKGYNILSGGQLHQEATPIVLEDWDNLIILDACRYDLFEEIDPLQGPLRSRISTGSSSPEFVRKNFTGRKLHDLVYVTANPHVGEIERDVLHDVRTVLDRWARDIGTVPPASVVDAAVETNEKYPNKRLAVHFMQPHHPFVSSEGILLQEEGWSPERSERRHMETVWQQFREGEVMYEEVWEAYGRCLKYVAEYVQELHSELKGKTVVTSDHGNMLGEWIWPIPKRQYAHPNSLYTEELLKVPHLTLPYERRKTVKAEEPNEMKSFDQGKINEQLKSLGYK